MSSHGSPHRRLYLDHAATTPVRPEVVEAMRPFFDDRFGNPSSLHLEGRRAEEALEDARRRIVGACAGSGYDFVFLASGTEADATALLGALLAARGRGPAGRRARGAEAGDGLAGLHLVTTAVEHPAVLGAAGRLEELGAAVTIAGADRDGRVDPGAVEAAIRPGTALVSVMAANNETGTLQPVAEVARRARARGVLSHTDAVQLLGKLPFRLAEIGCDLATISAHKIGGPRGAAGLFVRAGTPLSPLLRGGAQEGGRRAGTENVAAACGFAAAVELAVREQEELAARLGALRDRCRREVLARFPWAVLNSPVEGALPTVLNVSFPRVEGESLLRLLDDLGVAASTGSACNTGASKPSHVLIAMGRSEREVRGSLRLSFGPANRDGDAGLFLERLAEAVERLEALAPGAG